LAITPIWKATAEPKCKIYAWILLQRKILTADNLAKRGWPHDPLCKLCHVAPETPVHLCKKIVVTLLFIVWDQIIRWFELQRLPPISATNSIYSWWKKCRRQVDREHTAAFDGLVLHFLCNIWKERNRCTFQQVAKLPLDVAYLIKKDLQLLQSRGRTGPHTE
jgi:hypothetical protein